MKNILSIHRQGEGHWVGDGFPVHTIFHYMDHPELSPFLLLDHAGPADFKAAEKQRGVGWHPHRGFETVTIVFGGEVDHEDTAGNGGRISTGDVQWMTAGSGLLHKELHGAEFARNGGRFEVLQLWVNLPAKSKMTEPGYQGIVDTDIPAVKLADEAGTVRVIAGGFGDTRGPARTFTPINLLDVRLLAGKRLGLSLKEGYTASLYVLSGEVLINGKEKARGTELVVFDRSGDEVTLEATSDTMLFVMNGEPIDEPVFGQGPFVMNTAQQIQEAFRDFHAGRMGVAPAPGRA